MKKTIIITLGFLLIITSFYTINSNVTGNITYEPAITACSQYTDVFEDIFVAGDGKENKCNEDDTAFVGHSITRWSCHYHETVDTILEGILDQSQPSVCGPSSDDATKELQALADKLEPWKAEAEKPDDEKEPVTLDQAPSILQEYLRVYECALYEHETNLPVAVSAAIYEEEEKDDNVAHELFKHTLRSLSDRDRLLYELSRSREALQNSLLLLSRGRPSSAMSGHLECLQRISLDIRNIMGLAAEAGSCLPKSWNARDVLRDYKDREE
jgi:hypothetical protein